MVLNFLGGANEVGASATLIELNGHRILVDAGSRMETEPEFPDFTIFDKVGLPEVVLLTHAHTDHTGAFPVLGRMLPPEVKIYCTEPTFDIARILLEDGAKIKAEKTECSGGEPSYTHEEVAAVLKHLEIVPWEKCVEICEGVTARWIRAGHILGAAMIYIESGSESILMTGDVSHTRQLTIPSVKVPSWCKKPDVMVLESTYGDRRHEVKRPIEAKRLATDVVETIKAGGHVLIPVFAVGRAQEVVLILKGAMERKEIREFPVYVDGMALTVNRVYEKYPNDLQKALQCKVENREDIFYSEFVKQVTDSERGNLLSGDPCCIVAPSGMLKGGWSSSYVGGLISDSKNLIAITGYQAEGTPGRRLLDHKVWESDADQSDDSNVKPVQFEEVKSKVKRYQLSAHADRDELVDLVKKVDPGSAFLVHGDDGAREGLGKAIEGKLPQVDVVLPKNGETYTSEKWTAIAKGRRSTSDRILSEIAAFVRKESLERPLHILELASIWFGTEATTPIVVRFLKWCLKLDRRFFELKSDGFVYLR